MGEFLGNRPSSRVLGPPGGQTSNIFRGSDDPRVVKNTACRKPTYESSVFKTEPEPVKPCVSSHTDHMSSDIFGTDPDTSNHVTAPQKMSKTHQSSVFQDPEPLSEEKRKAIAEHHISNIPMFTTCDPEESKRPVHRPVTAPAQMPSTSLNLTFETNYATENKPGPGEITKPRRGYKPANQNLLSTVFSPQCEDRKKNEGRHCAIEVKPTLLNLPTRPRIRSRPIHRNEVSSLFPSESDAGQMRSPYQKLISTDGILGPQKDQSDCKMELGYSDKLTHSNDTFCSKVFESKVENDIGSVYSADDKMSCLTRQKSSTLSKRTSSYAGDESTCTPSIWSTDDHGVVRCTHRAQCAMSNRLFASSIFSEDPESCSPILWSSDFNMSPCKTVSGRSQNATFKSSVFGEQCRTNVSVSQDVTSSESNSEDGCATPISGHLLGEGEVMSEDFSKRV